MIIRASEVWKSKAAAPQRRHGYTQTKQTMGNKGGLAIAGLALGAALVGAATMAVVAELEKQQKKKRRDGRDEHSTSEYEAEQQFSARTREYMLRDMENLMIQFKRDFPEGSFKEFMMNAFPENITVSADGTSAVLDPRVKNADWEGRFVRVKATDEIQELGPPPSL